MYIYIYIYIYYCKPVPRCSGPLAAAGGTGAASGPAGDVDKKLTRMRTRMRTGKRSALLATRRAMPTCA